MTKTFYAFISLNLFQLALYWVKNAEIIDLDQLLTQERHADDLKKVLCLGHYTMRQSSTADKSITYKYCSERFGIHSKKLQDEISN